MRSERNSDLNGGCWSRSRYSVFFTISATGLLEVYDLLIGVDSPVTAFRVCNESLTAIAPHEDGQILALGSRDGNIYLVECSEGHIVNTRTDKANIIAVSISMNETIKQWVNIVMFLVLLSRQIQL